MAAPGSLHIFGVPTFGVHCMSRASYTKVQNQLLEFPASRRLQTLLHARLRDAQECSLGFKGRRFVVVLNLHIALEAGDLVSLGLFLPSYRTLIQLQVTTQATNGRQPTYIKTRLGRSSSAIHHASN